jgi:hypothetical protein
MLQPDEGDVVGDIDQAQLVNHLLDGLGDDEFAGFCVRLTVHEICLRSAFFE